MSTIRFRGIDHVQLAAPPGCEPAARAFFADLLGLEEIAKPDALSSRGGCWFAIGAQQLHVGVTRSFRAERKGHPAFRLASREELEALARLLEDAGVPLTRPSPGEIPGVARFFAEDPWGSRLEFLADHDGAS